MRRKKEVTGIIEGTEFPNKSYFTIEDKKYIFKGGIKGQEVNVLTQRKRKEGIQSKLLEVLEKSSLETEEPCPAFGVCGGCTYQTLKYEDESVLKKEMMEKLYADLYTGDLYFHPLEKVKAYRNKMEYSFGDQEKGGHLTLGMHSKGRFYEICDTTGCNIVEEDFETIRKAVETYFKERGFAYYRKQTHLGLLRHLVVRYAFSTKEILVNLVTSSQVEWNKEEFVEMLKALKVDGTIHSIYHTTNDSLADAVIPEKLDLLYGEEFINEELLGLKFQITPFSFFQPNPSMAEKLYERALELAGDLKDKKVYDLYSGTGTISQVFAKEAVKVYGIEIIEEAVESAKETALRNGLENVEFICGDVLEKIEDLENKVDVLVLDPPRDGIHPKAIDPILATKPETIVYISCNPRTQARDLRLILEKGYKLEKLEFFDQFPRTVHVESVVLMSRK